MVKREMIGYLRELVRERIGRIYPKDEVKIDSYKGKDKAREKQ